MNDSGSAAAPFVAVVTATYNRCGDVMQLLAQIAALNYPSERIHTIVVDNASTDGTAARVAAEFPHVRVIENSENLGTAVGFNIGIFAALEMSPAPKYIWLLDSDVILEPASLAPLVDAMENDSRIAVAGSAVYDPSKRDRLVAAGLRVDMKSGDVKFVIPETNDTEKLVDVDLIAACSLMVRSEPCRQVGVWDKQLRLYWGDTDWCVRFLRAGHRVVCHRDSRAWHRDWTDVDRGFFTPVYLHDHIRGALLFLARHSSRASARRLILGSYVRAAMEQLTMRLAFAEGYESAMRDFLAGSFGGRSFEEIVGYPVLPDLATVVKDLGEKLSSRDQITVTGTCPFEIKADFKRLLAEQFSQVDWQEPGDSPARKRSLTGGEIIGQLGQLVAGLLKAPLRPEVLVSPLSRPRLTNLVAAKYTVFLDSQGRGLVYENRIFAGMARLVGTLLRGLTIAFVKLPAAMKSPAVQRAIHAVDSHDDPTAPIPSPSIEVAESAIASPS